MGLSDGGLRGGGLRELTEISVIPDSVVNRWPLDEGSGQTGADAVGSDDISFNFENWVSGDWIGGAAVGFDGVDDDGDSTASTPANSMTWAVTVEYDDANDDNRSIMDCGPSSTGTDPSRRMRLLNGNIQWQIFDDSGGGTTLTNTDGQSANTKQRIVGVLDTDSGEIRIGVNGTVVGSTSISGNYTEQISPIGFGYRPGDSDAYYDGRIDEPLQDETAWSDSQVQDDYARQPWS